MYDSLFRAGEQLSVRLTEIRQLTGRKLTDKLTDESFICRAGRPSAEGQPLLTGEEHLFPESGTISCTAVFPPSAGGQNGSKFTVQTDQTTAERYRASDLMTAYVRDFDHTTQGDTVYLSFQHLNCRVSFSFSSATALREMRLMGVQTSCEFDAETAECRATEATGDVVVVNCGIGKSVNCSQAVLIPPQTLPAGRPIVRVITADADTLYATLTEPLTLKSGCEQTINLHLR